MTTALLDSVALATQEVASTGNDLASVLAKVSQQRLQPASTTSTTPARLPRGEKRELGRGDSGAKVPGPPRPCIPERTAFRKPYRKHSGRVAAPTYNGVRILEAPVQARDEDSAEESGDATGDDADDHEDEAEDKGEGDAEERRGKYPRLGDASRSKGDVEDSAAFVRLAADFAEDYLASPAAGRLVKAAVAKAGEVNHAATAAAPVGEQEGPELFAKWLKYLQAGFSVLVEGVGSKRRLLERFADEALMPWGATVVRMPGFSARFSLNSCLRGIFEQVHPEARRSGNSMDALCNALCETRQAVLAAGPLRPLVLVVHNVEVLPLKHQEALARLASKVPRLHLIVSVDSMWARLHWSPRISWDFLFKHFQVHTHEPYTAEASARFLGGLPPWADPHCSKRRAPKASLCIVLRSLTANHRELVQAMAERQLEAGGKTGITKSALLTITTDRMIALHAVKLKRLLNELKDHEVVVEKAAADGSLLYTLPFDERILQKLSDEDPLDGSDDEESGDGLA